MESEIVKKLRTAQREYDQAMADGDPAGAVAAVRKAAQTVRKLENRKARCEAEASERISDR